MSNLIEASNLEALNEILEQNDAVLVEFGAAWCGPCRQFLPHFEKFAEESDVTCVKVDIETDDLFATKHDIMTVPKVFLFQNGEKVADVSSRTVIPLRKEVAQHLDK